MFVLALSTIGVYIEDCAELDGTVGIFLVSTELPGIETEAQLRCAFAMSAAVWGRWWFRHQSSPASRNKAEIAPQVAPDLLA